jgi:hypothetical protein
MNRCPEYLFRHPDGTLVYVSADAEHFTYESFRMFIGSENVPMTEVQITSRVQRARDGGTTTFNTEVGLFHSPSTMFGNKGEPTLNGSAMVRQSPDDYIITENEEGVLITARKMIG